MQISSHCAEPLPGAFQHGSQSSLFGRLLSSAPGAQHRQAFRDWLRLNLELQFADLEDFLSSLPKEKRTRLEERLSAGGYSELVPADAPAPDRLLFEMDLETVLTLRQM